MTPTVTTQERHDLEGRDVSAVYDVARAAIAQQFQVSERLDNKARGIVTIAGAWFALVQAFAASAFNVVGLDARWTHWIVGTAAGGALALLVSIVLASRVWTLRRDHDIGPEGLVELRKDLLSGHDDKLLVHYAVTLRDRAANNKSRTKWYRRAQAVWYLAMLLPLAELGIAFAARAFG